MTKLIFSFGPFVMHLFLSGFLISKNLIISNTQLAINLPHHEIAFIC